MTPRTPEALLRINDGARPSRLALALALTGEAEPIEGPEAEAYAAEVQAAKAALPAFDFEVLRAASERLDEHPLARPEPEAAPWWRRFFIVPVLALAAAALISVNLPDEPSRRSKGSADLDFLVLRDGQVTPGVEGEALSAGDRVQFTYDADGLDSLVLLSVDGAGTLSQFYPARGDTPVAVVPGERRVLEGSIVLDDAPGPELFVAVFGPSDVEEAKELVMQAWEAGGAAAVQALKDSDPALDVVTIGKTEGRR